jgi:pSer/pThr/pTyr-binding forkhead associated (FHA) protein
VVGRHADCDVVLPHAAVSGRHCQLEWANGRWSVRDLGSRNGTRVDGVRCEEKALPPGSVLTVGAYRYRVVYGGSALSKPSAFSQGLLEKAGLSRWQPPEPAEKEDADSGRLRLDEP